MDARRYYSSAVRRLRPRSNTARSWIKWPPWMVFNSAIVVAVLIFRRGLTFPEPRHDDWFHKWRWRFEYLFELNEYQTLDVCRRYVRPGMRVVDLGAHVGYFTRFFAGMVGRRGIVYALEPHPDNFRILNSNISLADLPQVRTDQFLVGSSDGVGRLFLGAGHSNHTMHESYAGGGDAVDVPAARLDTLVKRQGIDKVDFVKIDCEGAEPEIIAGAAESLRSASGLLVEINPKALAAGNSSATALLTMIRTLGFVPQAICDDGTLAEPDLSRKGTYNIIALRTPAPEQLPTPVARQPDRERGISPP